MVIMDAKAETSALVSPAWLQARLDDPDLRIIEIAGLRPENLAAYGEEGHVPGALSWPWKENLWDARERDFPSPQEFARRMGAAGIGNDTTVVVYGEDIQFGVCAWWVFRYCGHRNVHVLDGARTRWKAEGRALQTDSPPAPAPTTYTPAAREPGMRVYRDEVAAALGKEGIVLLDLRSPEEYCGKRVGGPGGPDVGAMRYGRIPGARHLHYVDILDANKAFKPAEEIEALMAQRGVTSDTATIAYCRLSHRATVAYFALTELLGFDNVRIYDGSWTEWGNLVGAPIEC